MFWILPNEFHTFHQTCPEIWNNIWYHLNFSENEQPQVQDFADDMTAEMLASSEVGGEIDSSESSESLEGEYIRTFVQCT